MNQLYITHNNKYPHSSEPVWHVHAFNPRTKRNGLIRTTRSVGLRLKCTMRKFALEDILTELNLEHRGSRCKNAEGEILRSFCDAPGQLNVAKEWQSEHKLRSSTFKKKRKKSWLPYQQAAHLLGAKQGSWIIFNQEAHFIPLLFMFPFCFPLFTRRVVYRSLACCAHLDYPHSLFFIGLEEMSGFSKAFRPWNACRLESKAPNHS